VFSVLHVHITLSVGVEELNAYSAAPHTLLMPVRELQGDPTALHFKSEEIPGTQTALAGLSLPP